MHTCVTLNSFSTVLAWQLQRHLIYLLINHCPDNNERRSVLSHHWVVLSIFLNNSLAIFNFLVAIPQNTVPCDFIRYKPFVTQLYESYIEGAIS